MLGRSGNAGRVGVRARRLGLRFPRCPPRRRRPPRGRASCPRRAFLSTESAWHRRARRQRQAARGIVAISKAYACLHGHHGGGMPSKGQHVLNRVREEIATSRSASWTCGQCGFYNFGHREKCHKCPATRKQFGDKGPVASKKGNGSGNGGDKKNEDLAAQVAKLKAENSELRAARNSALKESASDTTQQEDDRLEVQAIRDKLEKAKQRLREAEEDDLLGAICDYRGKVAKLEKELDEACGKKPIQVRLAALRRKEQRAKDKYEKEEKLIKGLEDEAAEIQQKIEEHRR